MIRPPVRSSNCRRVSAISADAPEKHSANGAEVGTAIAHVGMIQQGGEQRRHAREERRPHLADRGKHVVEVAGVGHECERIAADERHPLDADVGVDVEQRQRQHDPIDPGGAERLDPAAQLQPRLHVGTVDADDAFRRARRAAAREDDCRIVRRQHNLGRRLAGASQEQLREPACRLVRGRCGALPSSRGTG